MSITAETVNKSSAPDGTLSTPSTLASPEPVEVVATTPRQRFTEPQAVYLKTKIPKYRKAQADKSWNNMWANIHGSFIQDWPQGPLTGVDIAAGITREDKPVQELKVYQYVKHDLKMPLTWTIENKNLVQQPRKRDTARGKPYP